MLLTEDEARTKRCQEGYAASDGVTDGPSVATLVMQNGPPVTVSFGTSYAIPSPTPTAPMHCIGSGCMAWRWTDFDIDRETGERFSGAKGFCGKAGRLY